MILTDRFGFNYTKVKENEHIFHGSLSGVRDFINQGKKITLKGKLKNINQKMMHELLDMSGKWAGVSSEQLAKDLEGGKSLDSFLSAKESLDRSGLIKKLQSTMADVSPRRRRVMSEHDGEWLQDRQWEMKPFSATQRALGSNKTLKIVADWVVGSSMEQDSIDRYGALVWAICQTVEDTGICTEIQARYWHKGASTEHDTDFTFLVDIKSAGHYMAPTLLAATAQAAFVRRANYSMLALAHEDIGKKTRSALSYPYRGPSVTSEPGTLYLSPSVIGYAESGIEAELVKAIG